MYFLSGIVLLILGLIMFILGIDFLSVDYVVFLLSINYSKFLFFYNNFFVWLNIFGFYVLCFNYFFYGCFYSHSYMSGDYNKKRFLFLVLMYIFSMMMMIISPNLISILFGRDGLGLVSYGLVIYFQNYKSYNAGMLTVSTNRIGDVAILVSIAWMFNFGSWHYVNYLMFWDNNMKYIFILLVVAAFTKSAQIPFSSWFPAEPLPLFLL